MVKDLTGMQFGLWKVLQLAGSKNGHVMWLCQCKCGTKRLLRGSHLTAGETKSCGCIPSYFVDLTGKRFGRLTVQSRSQNDKYGRATWNCICDCGKRTIVKSALLIKGTTRSCGCLAHESKVESGKKTLKDITGLRSGKLTAIKLDSVVNGNAKWICKCDCGKYTTVMMYNLVNHTTQSCGCITKSIGQSNIASILDKENITYDNNLSYDQMTEYIGRTLRFDFIVYEDENKKKVKAFIQFDGTQHTKKNSFYYLNGDADFQDSLCRDNLKNMFCLTHGYKLYRIPYWYRDKLTYDLLFDERFLVKSYQL